MVRLPIPKRPYDVTVFGCTGNAGRGVAYHVLRSMLLSKKDKENNKTSSGGGGGGAGIAKVALAGRNRSKIESTFVGLKQELSKEFPTFGNKKMFLADDDDVEIVVADADDANSMTEMTQNTKVLIACAGPYGRYGEPCVKACVETQTHYVDITGEIDFITDMIRRYEEQAKTNHVTLLPFSGYDCVPAELALHLTNDAILYHDKQRDQKQKQQPNESHATLPPLALKELNITFEVKKGGLPRGTINTVLDAIEGKGKSSSSNNHDVTTASTSGSENKQLYFYPKEYRSTVKDTLSVRNGLLPKYSNHVSQYTGPNFMASVNAPVLMRSVSSSLSSSSSTAPFKLSDRSIVVSGRNGPTLWNAYGLFPAQMYITSLVVSFLGLVMIPPFRSWVRNKLNTTYSYAGNPKGEVVVYAEGKPSSSSSSSLRSKMKLHVPGDAGIYATGLFAAAVATSLLDVVVDANKASTSEGAGEGDNEGAALLLPTGFHPPVAALHTYVGNKGHQNDGVSDSASGQGLLVQNLRRLGAKIDLEVILDDEKSTTEILDPATVRSKL